MTTTPLHTSDQPSWLLWLRGLLPYVGIFLLSIIMYRGIGPQLDDFTQKMLRTIGIAMVMAVSLNIVNGFTGQFSIGHAGFMAVGGYLSGAITYYVSMRTWGSAGIHGPFLGAGDLLFLASLLVGGLAAAFCGYIVGLPSLRLRGDYLAIVTLGFGEIVRALLQQTKPVLYSADEVATKGLAELPLHVGGAVGFDGLPKYTSLFWVSFWALLVILASYRIKASIHGSAFLSIRENEIAAEAMGVPTTSFKVKAFVLAAFFAGVGGGLYAHETGVLLTPNELGFQRSLEFVVIVVLGGMGSISGTVLAAIGLTLLPELLRNLSWVPGLPPAYHDISAYRMIIYALLLIAVMLLRPQGLLGVHELWELKWVRRLWARAFGKKASA